MYKLKYPDIQYANFIFEYFASLASIKILLLKIFII